MKTPNPIHIPGNAVIEEVGIDCMNEIEDHRIAGSVFVQYRKAVLNEKGEETDSIVLRFDLPVCIYNSARHPDLKALTVLEIEELFCKEVESVLEKLPRPFTANTKSDATDG